MTKHLTIDEAAEILGVHPNTVKTMLPRIGAVDLNCGMKRKRLIRIPEENLKSFLRECAILPPITKRQARPTVMKLERRRV